MPGWFDQYLQGNTGVAGGSQVYADATNGWLAQEGALNPNPQSVQSPSGAPPQGGQNWQQTFQQIMGGMDATPENLIAKEAELRAAGIEVRRNANGTAGKIGIIGQPDQIYDVIQNAEGGGGGAWQWGYAPPGGGNGNGGSPSGGGSLASLGGGVDYGARGPALEKTPGYQFVMKEALGALDRSAAKRGTILTGGHMKDLQDRAAGLASTEFGNEFGRNFSLAQLGFNAAGAQGAYGSAYGNQMTDLTTGAGNAQASGTAASGAAYGGMLGNMGNMAMQGGLYNWNPNGMFTPTQQQGMGSWNYGVQNTLQR